MTVLEQHIIHFFENHSIDYKKSTFIIGVSGGADSISCLYALHKLRLKVIAAHVNYNLRDKESDKDEEFVSHFCNTFSIPMEILNINCKEHSIKNKISIQESAREIRYDFFHELLQKHTANWIVTAHHKGDQAETILLHLIRGTGLKGLTGIPEKRSNILRPLLKASKKDILDFITENRLPYRTDSSNLESKYNRNFIRNKIIPQLEEKFNQPIEQLNKTAQNLTSDYSLLKKLADQTLPIEINRSFKIKRDLFTQNNFDLLRFQLSQLHFSETQVLNMINTQKNGAIFSSSTHKSTCSEHFFHFNPKQISESRFETVVFSSFDELISSSEFKSEQTDNLSDIKFERDSSKIYIDPNKIKFPLTLRKWQNGDEITPFGMKSPKKVSDILIDKKINRISKENILVLVSNSTNEVIWILNVLPSNCYKVDDSSKKILKLETKLKF